MGGLQVGRERVGPRRGDIAHPGRDRRRGQTMLIRQSTRQQVAGLPDADRGDAPAVHVGAIDDRIEHGGEHGLPVGPEAQTPLVQCGLLAGTVEASSSGSRALPLRPRRVPTSPTLAPTRRYA